jgi:hypothetical protein
LRELNRCSSSLGIVVEEPITPPLLASASPALAQQSQNSLYFSLLNWFVADPFEEEGLAAVLAQERAERFDLADTPLITKKEVG